MLLSLGLVRIIVVLCTVEMEVQCCIPCPFQSCKTKHCLHDFFKFISEGRFQSMMQDFMEKHYHHFEDVEENKLIYTDIFKEYVSNCTKDKTWLASGYFWQGQ